MNVENILENYYAEAMKRASGKTSIVSEIEGDLISFLDTVVSHSESSKAVMTVVLTSVVYKILHPEQDVRCHQSTIAGGYSGRTFDTKYVTPFLKKHKFPSMAESGWLTRSLEQKVPYDFHYTGAIKPGILKESFLNILNEIEVKNANPEQVLDYLLQGLIIQRDKNHISLATPQNLSIGDVVDLLDRHFHFAYSAQGASRLPVLALYAVYQCLVEEVRRYEGKILLPIESHTSADSRSGRMGDIDINSDDGTPFEAVEVKFEIPVSFNIVAVAKEKIETSKVSRYYILSTKEIVPGDKKRIDDTIKQIKNIHGCQLVVNGVKQSLKYYLRLIDDISKFIERYTELLSCDKAVMFEHRAAWNLLVAELK